MSRIITRDGEKYLVIRRVDKKGWKVARLCDGHWLPQDDARTLADVGYGTKGAQS